MGILQKNLRHIIVAIGVVMVWRGIWGLADVYLFPNDQLLSFAISVIIGVIILFLIDFHKKDISELH